MNNCTDGAQAGSETERALSRLRGVVLDGLRHGFFEGSVKIAIVNGSRRQLVIIAGRSYMFTIPEEEIK